MSKKYKLGMNSLIKKKCKIKGVLMEKQSNKKKRQEEEKLLNRIEELRKQLNQKINVNNTPQNTPATYALSKKLDTLIYQYMRRYYKTL